MIVFIQIGNSDDKLSQKEWAQFISDVRTLLQESNAVGPRLIGEWFSLPDRQWQNACWMVNLPDPEDANWLQDGLPKLCARYRQESIAWTEAPETEFLTAHQVTSQ